MKLNNLLKVLLCVLLMAALTCSLIACNSVDNGGNEGGNEGEGTDPNPNPNPDPEPEPEPDPVEYEASVESGEWLYNGSAHEPEVTVTADGVALTLGTDYTVRYINNVYAGTATVKITLKGEYSGTLTKEFTIGKMKVAKPEANRTTYTYNGDAQKYALAESEYYVITGNIKSEADTYTVSVSLKDGANYAWEDGSSEPLGYSFVINPLSVSATLSATDVIQGEPPKVTLRADAFTFVAGTDYDIDLGNYTTASNSAVATVTFKGNFKGSATAYYKVAAVTEGVEVLVDFNSDIADRTGKHTTEIFGSDKSEVYVTGQNATGTVHLTDAFHAISGQKRIVKVNDVNIGAKDFTLFLSACLYADEMGNGTNKSNSLIESSKHLLYKCDGTNKQNCPLCNGASVADNEFDFISVAFVHDAVSGKYPYRLRVQLGKEYMAYTLTESEVMNWLGNGDYIDIAVSVDREYAVSGSSDITRATLYVNGAAILSKDFTLAKGQVLGDDELYLGGALQWSSGGGVTERNRYLNTFLLYNGALDGMQIRETIPNAIYEMDNKTYWHVDDFMVNASNTVGDYMQKKIKIVNGYYLEDGAMVLAKAYEGVILEWSAADDAYIFKITPEAAATLNGKEIEVKCGDIVKTFTLTYQMVEALKVDNVTIYDFQIALYNKTTMKKIYFTVTDQDDNPVGGVSFSSNEFDASRFGAGSKVGEYYIELTAAEAESKIVTAADGKIYVTASLPGSEGAITKSFAVTYFADSSIIDYKGDKVVNGQKPDSYIEYVQDLGNKNWTIAFNVALGSIKKGDTVDLFTTSARDANIGITFSIKAESDTMWSARVRIGDTTYWHKGISFHNYKDFETVTVALELEWVENEGVRANVYYFGEENTSTSAYPETGMTSLDYDKTNKEGHTPVAKLVFGGVNTSLCQEDCNTIWQPSQLKNYDITFYEIVIVEGLLAEEVSKAIG